MKKPLKIPKFKNEDEERKFWWNLDLSEYYGPEDMERVSFPNLKPTTKPISNCDVDMTFDLMWYFDEYAGTLILSGDGDFAVVLKYLQDKGKKVTILARGERTAREIRQLAGKNFRDFKYLREILKFKP